MKLRTTDISIPFEHIWLSGELVHAPDVAGLAVVLRPAGSPFAQSRDLRVARELQRAGFATLLINLLTTYEETRDPDARFNVPQMANRVVAVLDWIGHQPPLAGLGVGLVASDTACGAAIRAGWKTADRMSAIVCRAGRPDLAGLTPLNTLAVPLRMVVGNDDPQAGMIRQAFEHLRCPNDWHVLTGVADEFREPGAIERFGELAANWLRERLPAPSPVEQRIHDGAPAGTASGGTADQSASSHPL
ncbi:alpha/beta hydrolase [Aromatoleum evansii]|uniref:Alpha/beta hydrolase n=1 Tax=Aromatoleum evansii TaxID=59406 RepID=A0ABZ1AJB0_AROEV|nr:alpha/beta hydrolase [Aromatoleum evansii]